MGEYGTIPPPGGDPYNDNANKRPRSQRAQR